MGLADTRLEQISAWRVRLNLRQGFVSAQTHITSRQVILLRVRSDDFLGWGEAAPVPGHSDEDIETIWLTLRALANDRGLEAARGSTGLLRAAFHPAIDDAAARRAGLPLWESLGGEGPVPASAAIGVDPDGQPSRTQIESAARAGYRYAKLKITPRTDPGLIADLLREHDDIAFGADANGSLSDDEGQLLAHLDRIGLEYIEQPGAPDDLAMHAELRRRLDTAISLDESAHSPAAVNQIIAAAAADIVNLKVGRFGTAKTLDIAMTTAASGTRVRVGGLIESGIGRAHTVALAAHPVFTVVGDIAGSDRYFANDLVIPQWRVTNGHLALPSNPGIGVTVDEEAIAQLAIDRITVS